MKQVTWTLLLLVVFFAIGCGSNEATSPPPLDEGTRAQIADEDSAVAAQESQQ